MDRSRIERDSIRRSGHVNTVSGPSGPSGPSGAAGIALDGIWVGYGVLLLSTYDASGLSEGTQVWVKSVGRFFRLLFNSTIPTSVGSVDIINAYNTVDKQWIGIVSQNDIWQSKTTWSIDPSNTTGSAWSSSTPYVAGNVVTYLGDTYVASAAGTNHLPTDPAFWLPKFEANDENTGADDSNALLTYAEFLRRTGPAMSLASTVNVRVLSNCLSTQKGLDLSQFSEPQAGLGTVRLIFRGIEQVLYSGTVTAKTDEPWSITDSAIPVSWTASGLVSSASGTRIIQKTTGNVRSAIQADLGSKRAQISIPSNTSATVSGTAIAPFQVGDAFQVLAIPSMPSVGNLGKVYGNFVLTDIGAPGDSWSAIEKSLFIARLCGFRNANARVSGSASLVSGSLFQSAITQFTAGDAAPALCAFLGVAGFNLGYIGTLGAGQANEMRGPMLITHGCLAQFGDLYLYGITGPNYCIRVGHNSIAEFAAIHGSGNTMPIVNVTEPGCVASFIFGFAGLDATTSATHPIVVCGTNYDYADLPAVQLNKMAGVAG